MTNIDDMKADLTFYEKVVAGMLARAAKDGLIPAETAAQLKACFEAAGVPFAEVVRTRRAAPDLDIDELRETLAIADDEIDRLRAQVVADVYTRGQMLAELASALGEPAPDNTTWEDTLQAIRDLRRQRDSSFKFIANLGSNAFGLPRCLHCGCLATQHDRVTEACSACDCKHFWWPVLTEPDEARKS